MNRVEKTQEIVNLITIRNYYQDIKPDFKSYWAKVDVDEYNKKYVSVIKKLDNEIETEVNFFLDGDKNQF